MPERYPAAGRRRRGSSRSPAAEGLDASRLKPHQSTDHVRAAIGHRGFQLVDEAVQGDVGFGPIGDDQIVDPTEAPATCRSPPRRSPFPLGDEDDGVLVVNEGSRPRGAGGPSPNNRPPDQPRSGRGRRAGRTDGKDHPYLLAADQRSCAGALPPQGSEDQDPRTKELLSQLTTIHEPDADITPNSRASQPGMRPSSSENKKGRLCRPEKRRMGGDVLSWALTVRVIACRVLGRGAQGRCVPIICGGGAVVTGVRLTPPVASHPVSSSLNYSR